MVFVHRLGEICDRTYENRQHRVPGLNLLVPAIILWITRYLEREDVPDHLLAHLLPPGWEHVNLTGDYVPAENTDGICPPMHGGPVRCPLAKGVRRDAFSVRYETNERAPETLWADLVVDASGRAAPTMSLLEKIGASRLEVTEIGIDQTYATAVFEIPTNAFRDWIGLAHFGNAPEQNYGGLILPIEHGQWIVSLGRLHGAALPEEINEFKAFVKSFRTPTFFDAISCAKQVGAIARYGMPASVRRHFDRFERFPGRLIPLGDSVCRFNPVFGQGMSVAAQEAVVLDGLLHSRCDRADPLDGLALDYLFRIQDLLEAPWAVALTDFVYPQTRGVRPPDLEKKLQYGAALTRLAAEDPDANRVVAEVRNLIRPQSALREPALARRVSALMSAVA